MDIPSALNVLCTASDESLGLHKAQIVLVLKRVDERLQTNLLSRTPIVHNLEVGTPSSFTGSTSNASRPHTDTCASSSLDRTESSDSERSPFREPSSNVVSRYPAVAGASNTQDPDGAPPAVRRSGKIGVTHGKDRARSSEVACRLVRGLKNTAPWLMDAKKRGDGIVTRKRSVDDRRLKDIRRVEGDPQADNENKLLRLLATRSLASEFANGCARDASPSKIEMLCHHVLYPGSESDISQKGSRSEVSDFVESHPQITAKALARRATNSGIKHLVFERVFKHRLQQLGLPSMCESISAIFGLNINQFKSLRYDQMSTLVENLLSDDVQITREAEDASEQRITRHILNILQDLTPWFEKLQASYNLTISPEPAPELGVRTTKCARYDIQADENHDDTSPVSETTDRLEESTTQEPTAINANIVDVTNMNLGAASVRCGLFSPDSRQSGSVPEYNQQPNDSSYYDGFEQDLFDQISTQPYDCSTFMDRAFEASLSLDNIVTLDNGLQCTFADLHA